MNDRPAALCVPMCARSPEVCAQLDWKKEMQTDSDFLCCQSRTRLLLPSPLLGLGLPSAPPMWVSKQFASGLFPPYLPSFHKPNPIPCLVNGRFSLRILRNEWRKRVSHACIEVK